MLTVEKKKFVGGVKLGEVEEKMDPVKLFQKSAEVQIMDVERGDSTELEAVVCFTVNEGKGTGKQVIPVSEFADYVGVLDEIIASGFHREDVSSDGYEPAATVARRSWRMVRPRVRVPDAVSKTGFKSVEDTSSDRCLVSVRTKDGQGQKPMLLHRDDFTRIVKILHTVKNNLESYEQVAWEQYRKHSKAE